MKYKGLLVLGNQCQWKYPTGQDGNYFDFEVLCFPCIKKKKIIEYLPNAKDSFSLWRYKELNKTNKIPAVMETIT